MTILGTIWSAAVLPPLGNDRRAKKRRAALAKKQRLDAHTLCLTSFRASTARVIREGLETPASSTWKPISITLTRVFVGHGRSLDDDNLRATFKHVRDGIADWLGVDDSPRSGIEWRYEQKRWNALGAPSPRAEWWATFETHEAKPLSDEEGLAGLDPVLARDLRLKRGVSVKRTDDLSATITRAVKRSGVRRVIVTNHTTHELNIEVLDTDDSVRVVIR